MEGIVENSPGEPRFDTTLSILVSSNDDPTILNNLVGFFEEFESDPVTSTERYTFMATELIRLKNEGVIQTNFAQPLSTVHCSFYQLASNTDYRNSDEVPDPVAVDNDVSPYASCGEIYGPELVFGHVMDDDERYVNELFSIVKFASGGSAINRHWSKANGWFWGELVETVQSIDTLQDEWTGIVWFQGENDSFGASNANSYENNLVQFIADLRLEMYNVDTSTFASVSDIPVVIVGLGCWVVTDLQPHGDTVIQAQMDFVANDENAAFVTTSDLSCHFHYDEASQLIIGERVALAMQGLLPNITPSPSSTPTVSLTEQPSRTPSSAPSGSPTMIPPSTSPSIADTLAPSSQPPSSSPSTVTGLPSTSPSAFPSSELSAVPSTDIPSVVPSRSPSVERSDPPSIAASKEPSDIPSVPPSVPPVEQSDPPSYVLSDNPTPVSSQSPSNQPIPWMYTEPDWWDTIVAMFQNDPTLPALKTCEKRQFPPEEGLLCGAKRKMCFWGNQHCPGGAYPTIECTCSARSWSCQPLPCTGGGTSPPPTTTPSSPSVPPTVVESASPTQVPSVAPTSSTVETSTPISVSNNVPSVGPTNVASDTPSIQPVMPGDSPWSYTVPDWWGLVVNAFDDTAHPLKTCSKRQFPPLSGDMCGMKSKTCFWGTQPCASSSYPATFCRCSGGDAAWACGDVACGSI